MGPLFARLSTRRVHTYRLVLSASRIPHKVVRRRDSWSIEVPAAYRPAAVSAIALYLDENAPRRSDSPPVQTTYGTRTYSAIYPLLALLTIHWIISSEFERRLFIAAYGADSDAILSGELYRCVTALLFHVDWAHLLANMAGLALFGTVVATVYGWGVGWLLIVVAGGAGNLLNAIWYQHNHLSVGASTAVFAAVGLCAVMAFAMQIRRSVRLWRAWIPLGGGVALLAFLGAAPHTDLMAHLFGFLVGLACGGLYAWRMPYPMSRPVQVAAFLVTLGLVGGSWVMGLR
jgi:membrane associated rhomboid family serine protease